MDKIIQDLKKRLDNLENFIQFNLKNKSSGQLYQDGGGSLTITSAGTYYAITSWTLGLINLMSSNISLGQLSSNERAEGTYFITFQLSGSCANSGRTINAALHKNGSRQAAAASLVYYPTAGQAKSQSATALIALTGSDYIDLRLTCGNAGEVFTIEKAQLTAYRIK